MPRVRVLLVACVCFLTSGTAFAQIGGGQISGLVADGAGGVLPGATVTATHSSTGATRSAVTSSAGLYALGGLRPGEYRVDVELSGFRSARREGIRVETGTTRQLDVVLMVGGLAETVTVSADASRLRATASLGQVVSEQAIPALPLNGRTFITLATLSPGVALPPATQFPRINGGRPRTNEFSTADWRYGSRPLHQRIRHVPWEAEAKRSRRW